MKKGRIILSLLIIIILIIIGNVIFTKSHKNKNQEINPNQIKVAATIFPIYDILKNVGGDKIEPILILPPGASPHTFEISPEQIKNLQNAKIIFTIGQNLDSWLNNIADAIPNSQLFDLYTQVNLVTLDATNPNHRPDEDEEKSTGYDPHYWLNPENAILIAKATAKQLSIVDSANISYYEERSNNFISQLTKADKGWKEKLDNLSEKNIVVFHDAWGYFADHFNLNIIGTFEPFPGQEPTPKYLTELQKTVEENNIQTLFVEPQLSQESITTLASDLGVKIDVLDPLGGVEGRNNYIELINFNVENIYNLLK